MGSRGIIWTVVGIAALLLVVVVIGGLSRAGGGETSKVSTFEVRRAPLAISVVEGGTIKALDQRVIKCEVEGRTTIISIVEEGARVEVGDLLIELDASEMVDRRVDQQIRVQNAEAAFIRARESLEVTKSQNLSEITAAELEKRFAGEDVTKYVEGEYPSQLMDAEAKVTLAEEELRRAADKLDWSTKLYAEKYVSETEFRADELAQKRAELEVRLAKESLRLLNEYTHQRSLTELEAAVEQTTMALDRVKRKASADLVQAEADLKAKEAEYGQQMDKLTKLDDQLAKTKMYAPVAGMVVYATSAEFSWRGDSEPLDEGTEVRERQELIYLPTADSMMVEIKIHESSLGNVQVGQTAKVHVEATGKDYTGLVQRIAPLPDATSIWLNPDLKVFSTQIVIDGSHPELRTGMSCESTIVIEEYTDAIAIPMQCVVREHGQATAYVVSGGDEIPTPIEIGMNDNSVVRVISGLDPGQRVSMTPPLNRESTTSAAPAEAQARTGQNGGTTRPAAQRSRPARRPATASSGG
ncbi:MAG: hypothetical protein DHS20C14_16890 [Phycisphaeraceae bacterium]|nr:MAG: hypothetical protein DHS20C14_16890 [Phycisphaeraceae bacterium]